MEVGKYIEKSNKFWHVRNRRTLKHTIKSQDKEAVVGYVDSQNSLPVGNILGCETGYENERYREKDIHVKDSIVTMLLISYFVCLYRLTVWTS